MSRFLLHRRLSLLAPLVFLVLLQTRFFFFSFLSFFLFSPSQRLFQPSFLSYRLVYIFLSKQRVSSSQPPNERGGLFPPPPVRFSRAFRQSLFVFFFSRGHDGKESFAHTIFGRPKFRHFYISFEMMKSAVVDFDERGRRISLRTTILPPPRF